MNFSAMYKIRVLTIMTVIGILKSTSLFRAIRSKTDLPKILFMYTHARYWQQARYLENVVKKEKKKEKENVVNIPVPTK